MPKQANTVTNGVQRSARIVKVLLGCGILLAGLLKLFAFSTDAASQYFYFLHPAVYVGIVIFEVVVGCWLLATPISRRMVGACGLLFGILGLVAFASVLKGAPNCGCLGTIPTPPILMLIVDIVVATTCVVFLFRYGQFGNLSSDEPGEGIHAIRPFTSTARYLITTVWVAMFGFLVASTFERGIYVDGVSSNLGELKAGSIEIRTLTVTNSSPTQIQIIGSQATCSCLFNTALPASIEPGESIEVPISINVPRVKNKEEFIRKVIFWTDSAEDSRVMQSIIGWIEPEAKSS